MFGFNKKKEKQQSSLDKILLGVVLGGAIGSVLGIGLAPKKGSETRKFIGKKAGQLLHDAKGVVDSASESAHKFIEDHGAVKQPGLKPSEIGKKLSAKGIPEEL